MRMRKEKRIREDLKGGDGGEVERGRGRMEEKGTKGRRSRDRYKYEEEKLNTKNVHASKLKQGWSGFKRGRRIHKERKERPWILKRARRGMWKCIEGEQGRKK